MTRRMSITLGLFLACTLHAMAQNQWLSLKGTNGIGSGQHVVFITGEEYYRSEEAMSMFARILSQKYGYKCSVLFSIDKVTGTINPNQRNHIPGLHLLEDADLMVIFARFRELPDSEMKYIVDYVNDGRPVIGVRNATHAFRYQADSPSLYTSWDWHSTRWPGGFGQQILGDTWVSHYGKFQQEATLAHINSVHRNHPVMQGVKDKIFIRTDVNGVNQLGREDKILLRGQVLSGRTPESSPVTDERKDTRMPLAWFRSYKAQSGKTGRAFCTTSGASVDWLSEDLRRLMVNVIFDLTGHTHEIPVETDVDFIMEYQPSAFGSLTDAQWRTKALTPDDFLPGHLK